MNSLSEIEKLECRILRELAPMVKAAEAENDLRARLGQFERIADLIESLCRILPQIDTSFWVKWVGRKVDNCELLISELYGDDSEHTVA